MAKVLLTIPGVRRCWLNAKTESGCEAVRFLYADGFWKPTAELLFGVLMPAVATMPEVHRPFMHCSMSGTEPGQIHGVIAFKCEIYHPDPGPPFDDLVAVLPNIIAANMDTLREMAEERERLQQALKTRTI